MTATADPDAGFVTIAAQAHTPQRAADVANAFAAAVVLTRRDQAVKRLNATIGRISQQLDRLRRDDRDGRTQLSEQLQRLRALRAAQGNNATVVEPAVASSTPIAPRVTRTVVLAIIVAMLLAGGAVVLAQGADRRLRDPQELEQITDGPLLSVIPASAFSDERVGRRGRGGVPDAAGEPDVLQHRPADQQRPDLQPRAGGWQDDGRDEPRESDGPRGQGRDPRRR